MKARKSRLKAARRMLLGLCVTTAVVCFVVRVRQTAATAGAGAGEARAGDEVERLIDSALYTRAEFFGAQARVPYPTAEARNRVAALREQRPKEARVTLALARLDEKLGRYDLAEGEMGEYAKLSGESFGALEELAGFQHRRALFGGEAATLERMLGAAPEEERGRVLERLVRLAESQKFADYLAPDFFEKVIAEHPADFRVVADYVERLAGKKETARALEALRRYRERFPSRRRYFMEKEVALLVAAGRAREAEAVYEEAFDPFWSDELSESFYDFLREHDRYRAYGGELREAFRRDPSNFKVAVRLFHFREHAYEERADIFARVEKARAARHIEWEPEELATAARLLIKEGDGDGAARFLYTLVARGQLEKGSPVRAKVLYQLFELLSDAGGERLALTRGDLRFYRDVASSDPHPGMLGGLLSLIFSGENPAREMKKEDERAVEFFNRAAAYRIFQAYKEENPTSPELAQMYLDVVRLYTADEQPDVASAALAEFEQRYGDAPQYPEVALKLADCYLLLERHDEERAVYRRILDYLGRRRNTKTPLVPAVASQSDASEASPSWSLSEPTEISPPLVEYPPKSNPGVKASDEEEGTNPYDYEERSYRDFLAPPEEQEANALDEASASEDASASGTDEHSDEPVRSVKVTYADVLARCVASLAKENRTEDVLALYAEEIKKYPGEQGLYEQLLQWLGQTNLFDEQSRVYKEALERFPTEAWRDRLARWLLRRERRKEFEEYSRELVGKLDDREAESYLEKFVGAKWSANATDFESNLYLGLYSLAHARFPRNLSLVRGLLKFHAAHGRWDDYRHLLAEYYFVSPEIREQFLAHLAEKGELRARLDEARAALKAHASEANDGSPTTVAPLPYKLFRADAAARLSNYEEAVDAYRELNRLYPATPEFAERHITLTRSLGQRNRQLLEEAASAARELADAEPSDADRRTRAGELFAELGDYQRARAEWAQLVSLAPGDDEAYLDAATVYWDYFQYGDALETIQRLRREGGNRAAYAFEAGAILEAEHRLPEALAEYVKALDETSPGHARASHRLATLFRRPGLPGLIATAYTRERAEGQSGVALGYAALLKEVGRWDDASRLLAAVVARSTEADFIELAKEKFSDADDARGERACLNRLIQVGTSPRRRIAHSLQLAESYAGAGERRAAATVLRALVRSFPVNYGVLQEASSFYLRLGLSDEALRVLRGGVARARGEYHRDFERKLAARLLDLNRADEARRVLESLHREDPLDLGVFRELARADARAGDDASVKAAFSRTLDAVRETSADPREMREQVAELRRAMIGVFTQLRDYPAAMEQHVEIINRDPDDEENVEAAIAYARRYGGGEELLGYYQKTAAAAYKNYRWNVVLARIYEAKGDLASATRDLKEAIVNQPEMVELHAALAEVYAKAGETDAALGSLARAAELSNDDPQYVRRTVEILEKAGRKAEAEAARRRLPPVEAPKKESARDLFADAERALAGDRAKAVEQYRAAFEALKADPYGHDLRASEITGYVRAVRDAEGLDKIFEHLWAFRAALVADAGLKDGKDAGRARSQLGALDDALPDAVGATAADVATGDELESLFRALREKIDDSLRAPDAYGALSLLQNLAHRAGFVALEEHILVEQKEAARAVESAEVFHGRLRALASFYASGGEYARAAEMLEAERVRDAARDDFEYTALLADYSRLAGDSARELSALRSYYDAHRDAAIAEADPLVERYFEALYESGQQGRDELARRAAEPSRYQLQLVNFLIAKGEGELARAAVAAANLPTAWKLAREAQLSLALREFDARGEGYFASALGPARIGELLDAKAASDGAGERPSGDDRARLETDYGRWLYLSGTRENRARSGAWLPGVVESRPRDAAAQAELARWYLARGDAHAALEHLTLADELSPDNPHVAADIGTARFLLGERAQAEAVWAKLIDGDAPAPGACVLYLKTLAARGLAREARGRLLPLVSKQLKDVARGYYLTHRKFDELKPLLSALSSSFGGAASDDAEKETSDGNEKTTSDNPGKTATSEAEKATDDSEKTADDEGRKPLSRAEEEERAAFFRKLCDAAPDDTDLPRFIVEGGLVGRAQLGLFYTLLVARSEGPGSYSHDYAFIEFAQNAFGVADVDEAFDHAESFHAEEPENERVKWQKAYLEYLLEEGENAGAERLASSIEDELSRRYARPVWLRLARVKLELRADKLARAVADLKHFTGADVPADIREVSAPSDERLSDAVALLRDERQDSAVPPLLEATYEQSLALGQYRASYFAALARLAFEGGDAERGEKLLSLMVALSAEETRDEVAAAVAALPGVSERFNALARAERPDESNAVERVEALRLAAETEAAFARYEQAAAFRATLSAERPDDYINRVELARLLAAAGKGEEAAARLAEIIGDRRAPRAARWQAVRIAPELTGESGELWDSLVRRVSADAQADGEMSAALKAEGLARQGRAGEAADIVETAAGVDPNPLLEFFRGLIDAQDGRAGRAAHAFADAFRSQAASDIATAFGADAETALDKLIRLQLSAGHDLAALKLASLNPELFKESAVNAESPEVGADKDALKRRRVVPAQDDEASARPVQAGSGCLTLKERAARRRAAAEVELLGLLSTAAEQAQDFGKAVEFERARLSRLTDEAQRAASEERVKRLVRLQKQKACRPALVVDQTLVARI